MKKYIIVSKKVKARTKKISSKDVTSTFDRMVCIDKYFELKNKKTCQE